MGIGNIAKTLNDNNELGSPWLPGSIRYLLLNEKYIGDTLHQKTYTPHILPFKKKKNRGQVAQYYVTNTHEPIISKELFNAVNEIIKKNLREHSANAKVKKHIFTGYLYCSDCNHVFKRLMKNNVPFWQCSKDGIAGRRCSVHPIKEEVIKRTFCRFYNRLRYYENEVLRSTLFKLSELKKNITKSASDIAEIDGEILKLSDKLQYCHKLYECKTIDKDIFLNRENEIKNKISALRKKRTKLLSEDDDELCIDELRRLVHFLEDKPKALIVFDYNIFTNIVAKIVVEENAFVFELQCGLLLREVIAWN